MTIADFAVLTGRLTGFHPSKRQPLPGTQNLWEGVRILTYTDTAIRAMENGDRTNQTAMNRSKYDGLMGHLRDWYTATMASTSSNLLDDLVEVGF